MKTIDVILGTQLNEFSEQVRKATGAVSATVLVCFENDSACGVSKSTTAETDAAATANILTGLCKTAQSLGNEFCSNECHVILYVDGIAYKDWKKPEVKMLDGKEITP